MTDMANYADGPTQKTCDVCGSSVEAPVHEAGNSGYHDVSPGSELSDYGSRGVETLCHGCLLASDDYIEDQGLPEFTVEPNALFHGTFSEAPSSVGGAGDVSNEEIVEAANEQQQEREALASLDESTPEVESEKSVTLTWDVFSPSTDEDFLRWCADYFTGINRDDHPGMIRAKVRTLDPWMYARLKMLQAALKQDYEPDESVADEFSWWSDGGKETVKGSFHYVQNGGRYLLTLDGVEITEGMEDSLAFVDVDVSDEPSVPGNVTKCVFYGSITDIDPQSGSVTPVVEITPDNAQPEGDDGGA